MALLLSPFFFFTLSLLLLAMEELDGDEVRVSSRGRLAERDIVQVLITNPWVDFSRHAEVHRERSLQSASKLVSVFHFSLTHLHSINVSHMDLPIVGGRRSPGAHCTPANLISSARREFLAVLFKRAHRMPNSM